MDCEYKEGMDAYYDGWTIDTNPYSGDPEYFSIWRSGWIDAKEDEMADCEDVVKNF